MENLPVTLIVKAPNQQIEDQTIYVEPSWTINKLKQHLSEVYPSKPPKHEQKLIYSGQLLNDSVVLKDILRQYEGQDTHTVHLVCTPKYTPEVQQSNPPARQHQRSNSPVNPTPPAATGTQEDNRHNINNINPHSWYQYTTQVGDNQNNAMNMDQYTMQMMMMQRAYMQYFAHYMNMAAQGHTGTLPPTIQEIPATVPPAVPPPQAPQNQDGAAIPDGGAGAPNAAAVAAAGREPEANRDWLDVFYMMSRIMIFISIVYFYSSPVRFLFVVLIACGFYLYQMGFFRNVNINNNNIMQGDGGEQQAPTRLMVIWMFFTTFFASLIPDIPNVV